MTSSELIALARRIAVARQTSAARFRELDSLTPGRQAPTWIIDTELAGRDPSAGQIELTDDEDHDARSARLADLFEPLPMEWITQLPTQEEAQSLVDAARADVEVAAMVGDVLEPSKAVATDSDQERPDDNPDSQAPLTLGVMPALESASHDIERDSMVADPSESSAADQPVSPADEGDGSGTPALAAENVIASAPVVAGIDEATHEAAVLAARQAGYEEGLAAARAELLASVEEQRAELVNLMESFRAQAADAAKLFEPLKRLSLHLAQELVRGELNLSGEAIGRLVDACLVEINRRSGRDVVLSLNPADLERWRTHAGTVLDGIEARADAGLSRGSVRIAVGETVIEDLIENRLQTLSRQLLGDSQAWRSGPVTSRAAFPHNRAEGGGLAIDPDVVDVD